MIEFKNMVLPVVMPAAAVGIAVGTTAFIASRQEANRKKQERKAMRAIRRHTAMYHSRQFLAISQKIRDLKTLIDMMSEISVTPLCEDKLANIYMLSSIFVNNSSSHKFFLDLLKGESSAVVMHCINTKELLLLGMLKGVDKKKLSTNLIVQGFDLMYDSQDIDNRAIRQEANAKGARWLKYGQYLGKHTK